ncbi:MAG: helix-turn-helix transcriptional regulator [Sphingomonas sp.]|uniref:helix-turn-helix domain-containing protein n=1 Tax=Sphingomonas sp. TaxID=28214 RepID=UPI001B1F2CE7|nr:helix-turn-helix transcriptional regulator [Sphingomonas sp.]MBO9623769.1 helix-turn-helix transcriptional regulator [Sphingomonas sp.]
MIKAEDRSRFGGVPSARGEAPIDLRRTIVFPNRMRELRRAFGFPKLLRLSASLPEIPYIRLSKIERGEVVPRPDELRRVGQALGIAPAELLLDVDAPGFDLAAWAEPFEEGGIDEAEERFAVYLGAALRARRTSDPALTIAVIEQDFGIPPVNLSRLENAQKTFARWNAATRSALFALFGVRDEAKLRAHVEAQQRSGALDSFIKAIADPELRRERMRARIAELAVALAQAAPPSPAPPPVADAPLHLVPVFGAALPDGLIAETPTGRTVEAPRAAGPRAFALRTGRATLGAGLPAQAIVIVDPDQYPSPGGLAAVREEAGWRLVSVGSDRDGRMIGYSITPERALVLDEQDPSQLARIVAALYV